jgi:hypothetical protein
MLLPVRPTLGLWGGWGLGWPSTSGGAPAFGEHCHLPAGIAEEVSVSLPSMLEGTYCLRLLAPLSPVKTYKYYLAMLEKHTDMNI